MGLPAACGSPDCSGSSPRNNPSLTMLTLNFRFVNLLVCLFGRFFVQSTTDAFTHSLARSLTHSITHALNHPVNHSLTSSLTHSLTHSLTPSVTHSLTHSLPHSLTHSLTQYMSSLRVRCISSRFVPFLRSCFGIQHTIHEVYRCVISWAAIQKLCVVAAVLCSFCQTRRHP